MSHSPINGEGLINRAFSGTAVKEGAFEEISLSDYLGKWVILVFYPMVCPLIICLHLS